MLAIVYKTVGRSKVILATNKYFWRGSQKRVPLFGGFARADQFWRLEKGFDEKAAAKVWGYTQARTGEYETLFVFCVRRENRIRPVQGLHSVGIQTAGGGCPHI